MEPTMESKGVKLTELVTLPVKRMVPCRDNARTINEKAVTQSKDKGSHGDKAKAEAA